MHFGKGDHSFSSIPVICFETPFLLFEGYLNLVLPWKQTATLISHKVYWAINIAILSSQRHIIIHTIKILILTLRRLDLGNNIKYNEIPVSMIQ